MELDDAVPPPPLDKPVWVDLDLFYGEPDDAAGDVAHDPPPGGYIKATGRVPGVLKRWAHAVDGRWFGTGEPPHTGSSAVPSAVVGVLAQRGVPAASSAARRSTLPEPPTARRRSCRTSVDADHATAPASSTTDEARR